MKQAFLVTFVCVIQATALFSQDIVAKINLEDATLEELFSEVEQQTSYKFLYRDENIERKRVSVRLDNVTVDELLNITLADLGLAYEHMSNNLIVITLLQDEVNVTGVVTDESGIPLPGANVVIKGTTSGVISDTEGKYSIRIPGGKSILQFSFVGFETQEVEPGDRNELNITLKEEISSIDEVVVTALGIEKSKRSLTYTTQQVDMQTANTVKDASLGNMLSGKIAGVSITSGSGASGVGSGSRVIIRGERSINGNNSPLIIMDGVPSNFGLDAINPDDVENINVLKGPSASALYGSAAANGVIIVTTNKGKIGESNVSVNSSTTFDIPYLYPDFQNIYGQGNSGQFNPNEEISSWGPEMLGQTVTDWTGKESSLDPQPNNVKEFFGTGYNLTNSLSYSVGNDKSTAYFSYTNITAGGVIPVNNMQRHNFNMRMDAKLLKNLNMDFVITWLRDDYENTPITGDDLFSPMWQLMKMPRSIRTADIKDASYYDDNGSLRQLTWAPNSTAVINPYWSIYGREAYSRRSNLNTVATIKYNFTPWLYLQLRGQMANNYNDNEEKLYWDTQYVNSGRGKYGTNYGMSKNFNGDVLLGVNKILNKDFSLRANLGAEIRDGQGANLRSVTGELVLENRFYLDNGASVQSRDTESHIQTQSVYGITQLSFRDYLFLDVTGRNDWNSTLPAPHDYFYPSVGLNAILSDIFSMPDLISFARIRGSYAEVGNGASFSTIFQTYSRQLNGDMGIVVPSANKVPAELIPERTKSWEAGAEIRILKDRFGIDVTLYKSNTYNQLVYVTAPPSSGYSSAGINCGNIQNEGVEIILNSTPLRLHGLTWDLDLNFSRNRNEVIALTSTLDRYEIGTPNLSVGDSWIIVGKPYGEILSRGFVLNEAGQILVDELGMPQISAESETYLGNFNYDWRSSLINNLHYKNWNLYFLIDLNYGGVRQSASEALMMAAGTSKETLNGREGFIFDGVREVVETDGSVSYVPNDIEITAEMYGKAVGGRATDGCGEVFNHKATNSRLREFSIGYTVPLKKQGIKNITISAVGRNLIYFYNACGWFDPDVSYDLSKNGQGSESAFLPGTRTIGLNIKLSL